MKMRSPLVTVCIPSYNHAHFIGECIQSVIDQSHRNIELIIIDDGSSDRSLEVIESYREFCENRFVRFEFRSRPNKGLSATLNEGIAWASGEFYSPIASDDVALRHKLSQLVDELLRDTKLAAAFGGIEYISDEGHYLNKHSKPGVWNFSDIILGRAFLPAPGSLLRTNCLRQVGGFDENLLIEDWSMWLKLTFTRQWNISSLEEIVARYRLHDSNMHKNIAKMHEGRLKILSLYANSVEFDCAKSNALMETAYAYTLLNPLLSLRLLTAARHASKRRRLSIAVQALMPNWALRQIRACKAKRARHLTND